MAYSELFSTEAEHKCPAHIDEKLNHISVPWQMLSADKEANPLKGTALHQGFLKATCKGKILLGTEFAPVPAILGLPWNCGAKLMLTTMDFNSHCKVVMWLTAQERFS